MRRFFLCYWAANESGISNPVLDYVDANNLPVGGLSMIYSQTGADNLPVSPIVIVLVVADDLAVFDAIKASVPCKMVPPYRLNKPLGDIPPGTRKAIIDTLVAQGLPKTWFDELAGTDTWGYFLRRLARFIAPRWEIPARWLPEETE